MDEANTLPDIEEGGDLNDLSISFHSSYDSINDDEENKSKSSHYLLDENSPLIPRRKRTRNPTITTVNTITNSLAYATKSFSRFTTSNYLGFSGSAYAVAHNKQQIQHSRTVSLAHIPSIDRYSPTITLFFTFMSMITGLSVFAIPMLVSRCGLVIVGSIAFSGLLLWYTAYLIHECQYQTSRNGTRKRVYENYIDLGKAAIKWKGEGLMQIIVGSSVCTDIYALIFCAQISMDLLKNYVDIEPRVWMLIWVALVFPLFFIRRMSVLAWLGLFALTVYVVGLCFTFGLLVSDHKNWSFENINPKFQLKYFFIGYGIIINSFNGHIALPALEASMKKPKQYHAMIGIAFSINTILKICFSVFGAATFGLLTQGSILTNLEPFGVKAMVINVLIGLFMFAQYPSSIFVVFEMLDVHILPKFTVFENGKQEWIWMFFSRLLITVFIAFVAVSIPNFEMVTSFVGNIRGTLSIVILPIFFYLKIRERKISVFSKVFHWLLIVVFTLFGLVGAGFSVLEMIK